MQKRSFNVNRVTISVADSQSAQIQAEKSKIPLVLVHGMACSSEVWSNQVDYFKQQRRVIAFDLRGHGQSSLPENNDFSPFSCAQDIAAVLAILGIEKVILIGHSYGSLVAITVTANFPELIKKLILVDPPNDCTRMPKAEFKILIEPMLTALSGDNYRQELQNSFSQALIGGKPNTIEYIQSQLNKASKEQLLGTSKELFTFRAADTLGEIIQKHPIPVSFIIAASNNYPYSLPVLTGPLPVETLPNTSHWLMLDEPAIFTSCLDKLINE